MKEKFIKRKIIRWLSSKKIVRSSKLCAFIIFGFWPKNRFRKTLWDNTTILFKKALDKWVNQGDTVLEIGAGEIAIMSIYLRKKKEVNITAADIVPEFVQNAKKNVEKQKLDIKVVQSDLFSNIKGKFDLIFSNPPYVPTSKLNIKKETNFHGLSSSKVAKIISDGGNDGLKIIEKMLSQSKNFLKKEGRILLGFNTHFININTMKEIIKKSGLKYVTRLKSDYSGCNIVMITK